LIQRNPALKKDPSLSPPVKTGIAIAALGLLLIVTAVTLLPTLNNGFVNWDDDLMVVKNPKIFRLSGPGIKTIFTSFDVNTYVPLTILTFAFEYRAAGMSPRVFHTTNYLLHLVNCLLAFWLILLIARDVRVALIAALLFGIHPLHVESVAWITERKDVLSSAFFLGGLITYLRYLDRRKVGGYLLTLGLFLLALLAKPMALSFPFVILLLDYIRGRKLDHSSRLEKIPFFALSAIFLLVNVLAQEFIRHSAREYLQHIFIFGYSVVFYIIKIILPLNLSAFHPYPANLPTVPLPYFACLIFVLGLAGLIYRFARKIRAIVFGAFFFLITILPVSQIVPLAGPALVSDRYTYIPSLGLFFLFGLGFIRLYERRSHIERAALTMLLVGVVAALAVVSRLRVKAWKNGIVLWSDVLARLPNHPLPYNNLGSAYYTSGDYDRAFWNFEMALALKPDYDEAYLNRGLVYYKIGMLDSAQADFTRAIKYKPKNSAAFNSRGVVYNEKKDYPDAIADLTQALKIQPDQFEAYNNLGNSYLGLLEYDRAIDYYQRSLVFNPLYAETYYNLGSVYYLKDNYLRAIAYFSAGIQRNPRYEQCYYNRGSAYYVIEKYSQALADYYRVLDLNPKNAGAYYNIALTYYIMGEYDRARENLETSIRMGFAVDPEAVARIRSGGE